LPAARDAYHKALVAAESAGDGRRRVEIYVALAVIDKELDRKPEARDQVAQARALSDHLAEPSLRWQLAWAEASVVSDDDPKRSVALLREAIAARGDADDARGVALVRGLGAAQVLAGDVDEGRQTLERALALGEKLLGPSHPQLVDTLTVLGAVFVLGDRERAHLPNTAITLSMMYMQLEREPDAFAVLDRTIAAYRRAFGDNSGLAAVLAMHSGMLAYHGMSSSDLRFRKSQLDRALAERLEANAIQRKLLAPDNPELVAGLEWLGRIQRWAGTERPALRSDRSRKRWRSTRAIRSPHPTPPSTPSWASAAR
jgi:hypothetical protein